MADQKYLIDVDGVAFGPQGQIDPTDIGTGEYFWDFRPGEQDLGNIVWASGRFDSHALPPLNVMKGG
jgi:hypothetical protein